MFVVVLIMKTLFSSFDGMSFHESARRYVLLYTASSFLCYKSVDQSELRFRLLVGLVDGGDLWTSIFALHSAACSNLELSFQFFQRSAESFLLLASNPLLYQ